MKSSNEITQLAIEILIGVFALAAAICIILGIYFYVPNEQVGHGHPTVPIDSVLNNHLPDVEDK